MLKSYLLKPVILQKRTSTQISYKHCSKSKKTKHGELYNRPGQRAEIILTGDKENFF